MYYYCIINGYNYERANNIINAIEEKEKTSAKDFWIESKESLYLLVINFISSYLSTTISTNFLSNKFNLSSKFFPFSFIKLVIWEFSLSIEELINNYKKNDELLAANGGFVYIDSELTKSVPGTVFSVGADQVTFRYDLSAPAYARDFGRASLSRFYDKRGFDVPQVRVSCV